MGEPLIVFKGQCMSASKTRQGASIQLANNVTQTDRGPAATEIVAVTIKDADKANSFTIDKSYTVTISED